MLQDELPPQQQCDTSSDEIESVFSERPARKQRRTASPPGTEGHAHDRLRSELERSKVRCRQLEEAIADTEKSLQAVQQENLWLATVALAPNGGAAVPAQTEDTMSESSEDRCSSGSSAAAEEQPGLEGEQPGPSAAVLAWGNIFKAGQAKAARQTAAVKAAKMKELPVELRPTEGWDLPTFKKMEAEVARKRERAPLDNFAAAKPRKGRHGAIHHHRHGLAGSARFWARGSQRNAERLVLQLVREFHIEDAVRAELFKKVRREAETDKMIVDRLVAALDVLKGCQTEQQRRDFHLALSLVAPERVGARQEGLARRFAARLRVSRGKRSQKRGQRPYAFDACMDVRADFDADVKVMHEPPQIGERVLTCNGPAELTRWTNNGDGCVVTYRAGDAYAEREYRAWRTIDKHTKKTVANSARLRRVPPSLTATGRKARSGGVSDTTRKAILDHTAVLCPTSPHTRDVMKRRVAPFTFKEKPAFIQSLTEEAMFTEFRKAHPGSKIKFSQYKLELPWNRKKAYRSTCLDRAEVNFEWHRQAFKMVMDVLAPLHSPSNEDAEGEAEATAELPDPRLKELAAFAALGSRTEISNTLVQPCCTCLGDATGLDCIDKNCQCCGMQRLWSKGVRAAVMQQNTDGSESVRGSASSLWEQQVSWDAVKPGGDGNGDSAEDSDLRHTISGTIVECLDAIESAHRGWLPHRFHAVQAKASQLELRQNATPGMLLNDSDWSENGTIEVKDQMQSEYWHIRYYSLLISITAFLVRSAWKDVESALRAKAEVTVQPADAPVEVDGSPCTSFLKDSYFAEIEVGSDRIGPGVLYTVVRPDGSRETLPRHRLRHRVWHRVAFLGVTNEKKHVTTSTQVCPHVHLPPLAVPMYACQGLVLCSHL